jgi:hypothetical protein
MIYLKADVEQQFLFLISASQEQSASGGVAERKGQRAAEAKAGLLAVFGVNDEIFAVEDFVEGCAIGADAESAGCPLTGTIQVGQGVFGIAVFSLSALGLQGRVGQQDDGDKRR